MEERKYVVPYPIGRTFFYKHKQNFSSCFEECLNRWVNIKYSLFLGYTRNFAVILFTSNRVRCYCPSSFPLLKSIFAGYYALCIQFYEPLPILWFLIKTFLHFICSLSGKKKNLKSLFPKKKVWKREVYIHLGFALGIFTSWPVWSNTSCWS